MPGQIQEYSSLRNLPFIFLTPPPPLDWPQFQTTLPDVVAHMSISNSWLTFYKLNLFHITSKNRILALHEPTWVMCPSMTLSLQLCRQYTAVGQPWVRCPLLGPAQRNQTVRIKRKGWMDDLPIKYQNDDTRKRHICQSGKYIKFSYKCLLDITL